MEAGGRSPTLAWYRRFQPLFAVIFGATVLGLVARRIPWQGTAATLKLASLGWLAFAVFASLTGVTLRALRLHVLLAFPGGFLRTWRCVALGALGGALLPFGGGEVVKVAALRAHAGVPPIRGTAAVALDRLFDLSVLLALILGALGPAANFTLRSAPLLALETVTFLLVATLLVIALGGGVIRRWIVKRFTFFSPWLARYDHVHDLVAQFRKPRLLVSLAALQSGAIAMDFLSVHLTLAAFPFGGALPFAATLRTTVFILLAFALPVGPGALGSHQVASLLALRSFGPTPAEALAFSLAAQGCYFIVIGVLSAVAFASAELGFRNVLAWVGRERNPG